MSKTFYVMYEGRVQETYVVEAESEEEARERWSETEPVSSEVIDGEIVDVEEVSDDH